MAKKIKHNLEDIVDTDISSVASAALEKTDAAEEKNASADLATVTKEEYLQLKELKTIKEQNLKLIDEKSKMTELISGYLEDIDKLKAQIKKLEESNKKLQEKNEKLEKLIKDVDANSLNDKINSLENENNMLNMKYTLLMQLYNDIVQKFLNAQQDYARSQQQAEFRLHNVLPRQNGGFYYLENGYKTWN